MINIFLTKNEFEYLKAEFAQFDKTITKKG